MLVSTLAMANAKGNENEINSTNSGVSNVQIQKIGTPYQVAIKEDIENGNLTPSIKPEYNIEVLDNTKNHLKVKGTTKIQFNNPKEAGFENNKWPKFVIKDSKKNMIGKGIIKPGDYDQLVKDFLKSKILDIQNKSQRAIALAAFDKSFESGQMNHIITEIYEITYPENISSSMSPLTTITNNDILMGFTINTPKVNWIVEDRSEKCIPFLGCFEVYYYKAGFEIDTAIGLRLPTKVTINLPATMISGQNYILSTSIDGQDWNGDKYSNVNIPSQNGNEFVAHLKFFLGVIVRFAGKTVIDWTQGNIDKDYGRSFKTPIGPNELPIPDLFLSPDETGLKFPFGGIAYYGIGLKIDPNLYSEKITAEWKANGDSIGNGNIEYYNPNINYQFGAVQTGNYSPGTNYAQIRLSNYKYYFKQCNFDIGANVQFKIFSINVGFTPYVNIFNKDCSLTGGLYLGTHEGTTANNANGKSLVIPYISVISPNGGEIWDKGTTHNINWKKEENVGPYVKIQLYKGGILSNNISSYTPNNGSYNWTIPLSLESGNDYKIRITSTSNVIYKDDSDNNFAIGPIYEDFNDNSINTNKWILSQYGNGPSVKETNKRLEINIPYLSNGSSFGAGYETKCRLKGDFDIRVDYNLLNWPYNNGVSTGFWLDSIGSVERISFEGKEKYIVYSASNDKIIGESETNHNSGKLRLVRRSNIVKGYYYNGSGWEFLGSITSTTNDIPFLIGAWSSDYIFADKDVKVALDNVVINYGQLKCP